MKQLIQHLVREHLPQIAAKSLLNCHTMGLHSIMLVDSPEQRIRLFIATPEHELWLNTKFSLGSIAAHPHHCNITLHCIQGSFTNYRYAQRSGPTPYLPYRYTSSILTGQGGFVRELAEDGVELHTCQRIEEGGHLALGAHVIHSVGVAKGQPAAWFVYEGKEDPEYTSLSYSDQPLEQASFEGLYEPMWPGKVVELLESVELLPVPLF